MRFKAIIIIRVPCARANWVTVFWILQSHIFQLLLKVPPAVIYLFKTKSLSTIGGYGAPSSTERRVILWSIVISWFLATRSTPAENKLSCAARSVLVTHIPDQTSSQHNTITISNGSSLPKLQLWLPYLPGLLLFLCNRLYHYWHDFGCRTGWGFSVVSAFFCRQPGLSSPTAARHNLW